MANTDPYRLSTEQAETSGTQPAVPRGEVLRGLLWSALVVSAAGNMVASYTDAPLPLHLACGLASLGCVIALLAQRLRGRR